MAGSSVIRQSETILARSCEAGRVVRLARRLQWLTELRPSFYPLFYPPMEIFEHDLSASEMTRFLRFTQR